MPSPEFQPYQGPLSEPAKHSLGVLFRELRRGRPAIQQRLLTWLADFVEREGIDEDALTALDGHLSDPADWWKQVPPADEPCE